MEEKVEKLYTLIRELVDSLDELAVEADSIDWDYKWSSGDVDYMLMRARDLVEKGKKVLSEP